MNSNNFVFFVPNYVVKVLSRLVNDGHAAFLVGGCVRDCLLHKTPSDYDVTTDATVNQIKQVFKDFRQINDNGQRHGTVSVISDGHVVEVSAFKDGLTLVNDLSRRDLTINAMGYDYFNSKLIDPYDGQKDLENKIIRTVGDPRKRFEEDPLRIYRCMRFASCLEEFKIDDDTSHVMLDSSMSDLVKTVSVERFVKEFKMLHLGANVKKVLSDYRELISYFIPEIKECFGFAQNSPYHKHDVYEHTLAVIEGTQANVYERLAAFFHDIGKPRTYKEEYVNGQPRGHFPNHAEMSATMCRDIMKRLKFSTEEIEHVTYLVRIHSVKLLNDKRYIAHLLKDCPDVNWFLEFLDLRQSDRQDHVNIDWSTVPSISDIKNLYYQILDDKVPLSVSDLDIDGHDIMSLGYKGKDIGIILNKLLDKVIDESIDNDRTALLSAVRDGRHLS